MDWNFAIEKHTEALKRIVAMLVAMAGLTNGIAGSAFSPCGRRWPSEARSDEGCSLPRHLHRFILRLLRPAEAAARRLIVLAARGLVVLPGPQRPIKSGQPSPFGHSGPVLTPSVATPRPASPTLALPLVDPLPGRFRYRHPTAVTVPRISFPGWTNPTPLTPHKPPAPDDLLDAGRIHRRLAALASALEDLPRQAKRLAPWRARRPHGPFHRVTPLRGGRPPGWRKPDSRRAHPVHSVLDDLHGLAFWSQEKPDTS